MLMPNTQLNGPSGGEVRVEAPVGRNRACEMSRSAEWLRQYDKALYRGADGRVSDEQG